MKLIITIDTEEDNWSRYSQTDNPVENIEKLFRLQRIFDQYGARPTYLMTYPVVTNPRSVSILKLLYEQGGCELGSHCHPWNTPPFGEEICEHNSMLSNLPETLLYEKLKVLHEAVVHNLGVVPVSFRAGRWGFSSTVARCLVRLGYRVDTSVSPYLDWGVYQGPDYSSCDPRPFRFSSKTLSPQDGGELLQVPASVGFLQSNFRFCQRVSQHGSRGVWRKLHLLGILMRLKLLNLVWLSPEYSDAPTMIRLADRMRSLNFPCLNMTFHSNSLMKGMSPFVTTEDQEREFYQRIESFLMHAKDSRWDFMTLSQYEADCLN